MSRACEAIGLSRTAAEHLAERIDQLVRPNPADAPARSAQPPHQPDLTA
jgi:hypothetical protein